MAEIYRASIHGQPPRLGILETAALKSNNISELLLPNILEELSYSQTLLGISIA